MDNNFEELGKIDLYYIAQDIDLCRLQLTQEVHNTFRLFLHVVQYRLVCAGASGVEIYVMKEPSQVQKSTPIVVHEFLNITHTTFSNQGTFLAVVVIHSFLPVLGFLGWSHRNMACAV